MRVAVSGHRGLPEPTVRLINAALRTELAKYSPGLVGISCLADGADAMFAQAVLDLGGNLEVVIPAAKYRDALPAEYHATYDTLLEQAKRVRSLDFVESTPESHMAASIDMLTDAEVLMAVWDGLPSRSFGGTADVVDHARAHDVPVIVVWPQGAQRD